MYDACLFRNTKGEINHHTMQLITAHGIFNQYRKKINKDTDGRCWDSNADSHDAEHALFNCSRCQILRTPLENHAGELLTPFWKFCETIMKTRQLQEKEWEQRRRRKH